MLQIICASDFLKSCKKLPPKIQDKLVNNLELLKENPYNPLLHSKALAGQLAGFYSFRITRDWRVIFCFLGVDIVKVIDVAHRKDIYK